MFDPVAYAIVAVTGMVCFILTVYEFGRFVLDLKKGARRNYHLAIGGGLISAWALCVALLTIGTPVPFALITALICGAFVGSLSGAMLASTA